MKRIVVMLLCILCSATMLCCGTTQNDIIDAGTVERAEPTASSLYSFSETYAVTETQEPVTEATEPTYDGFDPEVNYLEIMKDACLSGDYDLGTEAEKSRNKKIEALSLEEPKIEFDELYELAKIITAECGSSWLSVEWKMSVGEVVMNRVASPEFPDTIHDVIHQPGQYSSANTQYFANLLPFEDCVDVAARLLSGERILNEPSVVFQSSGKQGSGVHTALYDSYYGYTYLCYSSYPSLYEEVE